MSRLLVQYRGLSAAPGYQSVLWYDIVTLFFILIVYSTSWYLVYIGITRRHLKRVISVCLIYYKLQLVSVFARESCTETDSWLLLCN